MSLLLGAFEDGELEPHEMHEVARHLSQCARCESEVAAYAGLGRELRTHAVIPDLTGFSSGVAARIGALRPSLWVRLGGWLDRTGQRTSAGLALGAAVVAAAALTVVLVTPYAQNAVARGISSGARVASAETSQAVVQAAAAPAQALDTAADASRAIISRLETESPAVAVWSAPVNDTTVIWIPDQQ